MRFELLENTERERAGCRPVKVTIVEGCSTCKGVGFIRSTKPKRCPDCWGKGIRCGWCGYPLELGEECPYEEEHQDELEWELEWERRQDEMLDDIMRKEAEAWGEDR